MQAATLDSRNGPIRL